MDDRYVVLHTSTREMRYILHMYLSFHVGTLLLPPGLLLWFSAISRLSSHTGYHYIINVLFIAALVITCYVVGSYYFVDWNVKKWLEWDFDLSSTILVQLFQGVFLVLTLWLTGLVLFPMFIRVILQRTLYSEEAKQGLVGSKAPEAEPLIGSELEPIKPSEFSLFLFLFLFLLSFSFVSF